MPGCRAELLLLVMLIRLRLIILLMMRTRKVKEHSREICFWGWSLWSPPSFDNHLGWGVLLYFPSQLVWTFCPFPFLGWPERMDTSKKMRNTMVFFSITVSWSWNPSGLRYRSNPSTTFSFECLNLSQNELNFNDPKEFDDPRVFDNQKVISKGSVDFEIPKLYGDTSILDGLSDLQRHMAFKILLS